MRQIARYPAATFGISSQGQFFPIDEVAGHDVRSVCGRRTQWVGATLGLHVFVVPSSAPAQENERPERDVIRIEYEADPSCPSRDELIAKVRAYTSRWSLAEDGERARKFRIELLPRDGRVVGVLGITEPAEGPDTSAPRTISGPDCETVARGMAIAVAVAIDPSALLSERTHGSREPEPTPPAAPAPPPSPAAPRERPRPPPSEAPAPPPFFAFEARAELTSSVVVGMLPVLAAAFEVEPFAAMRSDRVPRWLRPSVAIGVRQSLSRRIERSTVTTEFEWTAGVLRLCPARFLFARDRLEVTPCVEGDLGVLRAHATGSSDARSTAKLWIDAGASVRATWSIGDGWFVSGAASALVPVSRNRFELSTGALVSRAPTVGVMLGLGGGLRF